MKAGIFRLIRYSTVAASLISLAYVSYSAGHYLRTSQRFEVRQLSVSGLRRVQETQVVERADFDIGTNVFAVDLDNIRQRVEGLQWVHHAVVQRVLPNEIKINVTEREPIGLARIKGEIYEFDVEGVVLDPDPVSMPSFPVLDGLFATDAERNKDRVRLYRKVLEELGQNELSEIHINAAGEVSVVSS